MIISIDWLKEFVLFNKSPKDIANGLTAIGLETTYNKNKDILDIELTPNRPDCMSHLGVAREVSILTGNKIKRNTISFKESSSAISNQIKINVHKIKECPRYGAMVIKGIKVGKSPDWMVSRLEQCGIRSLNSIVDISNYVLLELGHPVHIFDFDSLAGKNINIRTAIKDEEIITIDGIKRKLQDDQLLICDQEKPVALAGILGGKNSEVTEKSKNILVECAYFDPVVIRKGAKVLGLSTEASKRFERGVDYDDICSVLDRVADLILEISGGECTKGIIDYYPEPIKSTSVSLNPENASSVLGINLDNNFISKTFDSLGIKHTWKKGLFECKIPSNRPDLERPIDLIEEIGRIYGFDNIKSKNNYIGIIPSNIDDEEMHIDSLKDYFRGIGFNEVMTNSLVSSEHAELVSNDPIKVSNPLSREMSFLRSSLFPGLLSSARYNIRRGESNLAIFEYGNIFCKEKQGWMEKQKFSGIVCGNRVNKGWKNPEQFFDLFLMKGVIIDLAKRYHFDHELSLIENNDNFLSNELTIKSSSLSIGKIGNIKQDILNSFEIEIPIFAFDLNLRIFTNYMKVKRFQSLPQFPGIERDLSLTIPNKIQINQLEKIIKDKGGSLLQCHQLYDLYEGDQIEKGFKSATFSLFFRSDEKTLKYSDVDFIVEAIISETSKVLGAKLR
tara:strand:+ start:14865 stop:16883 length:2019 start_codon:yes stop_codon:yes gene_type:complete